MELYDYFVQADLVLFPLPLSMTFARAVLRRARVVKRDLAPKSFQSRLVARPKKAPCGVVTVFVPPYSYVYRIQTGRLASLALFHVTQFIDRVSNVEDPLAANAVEFFFVTPGLPMSVTVVCKPTVSQYHAGNLLRMLTQLAQHKHVTGYDVTLLASNKFVVNMPGCILNGYCPAFALDDFVQALPVDLSTPAKPKANEDAVYEQVTQAMAQMPLAELPFGPDVPCMQSKPEGELLPGPVEEEKSATTSTYLTTSDDEDDDETQE